MIRYGTGTVGPEGKSLEWELLSRADYCSSKFKLVRFIRQKSFPTICYIE